jgi:small subunit ribosomal protein S1
MPDDTPKGSSTENDFSMLLAEYEDRHTLRKAPRMGDRVRGQVVSIGADSVLVDLGTKAEAAIALEDVTDEDGRVTVAVGTMVEAHVAAVDDATGTLLLRTTLGRTTAARDELEQAYAHGIPVEGTVGGVIKGGVEVKVAGVRAFCPVSQLDTRFVEDAAIYVGQRLRFRITRYEEGRRLNLVVSRRALLEEEARERAAKTREHLAVGAVLRGVVTSLKDYGAFVDLGGIEGMIHVSELGFARVGRAADVLAVGQTLDVQVLKIEKTSDARRPEKVALSIRSLEADPFLDAEQRFPEGARVRGRVARVEAFGAFIELAPGIEGLVHVSELGTERHIHHPREVVKVGNEVEVTVLRVDREKRRIALSMSLAATGGADEDGSDAAAALREANQAPRSLGTLGDVLQKSLKKQP